MPERRILHCEDSDLIRTLVERSLPAHIKVVAFAPTLATSLEQLEAIKRGELDVTDILLDGQLAGHKEGENHPRTIVDRAKELGITAAKGGLSSHGLEKHWGLLMGPDIVFDITKEEFGKNLSILAQRLDALPEPEPRTP